LGTRNERIGEREEEGVKFFSVYREKGNSPKGGNRGGAKSRRMKDSPSYNFPAEPVLERRHDHKDSNKREGLSTQGPCGERTWKGRNNLDT